MILNPARTPQQAIFYTPGHVPPQSVEFSVLFRPFYPASALSLFPCQPKEDFPLIKYAF